ncbi:MAG TPA: AI-2E family transporter [Chloroflexota bacterium]
MTDATPESPLPVQERSPSLARWAGYVAVTLIVVGCFYALYLIRAVLFLFLVAVLLATSIEPLVIRVRRGPLSRGQGILIVYTGIMLVLAGVGALAVPIILSEAGSFSESYPRILDNARHLIYSVDERVLGPTAEKVVEKAAAPTAMADDGQTALSVGLTVVESLFASLTVFVVAFYWLTERVAIRRAFVLLFPNERRQMVGTIWNDVEGVLGSWVRGQLLLMLFIGVLAGLGYTLMGMKYAIVLAILAALFEIVPLVGPWLGAIPAILVALTQDVRMAFLVAGYILIIQMIEGNVLVPRVMGRTVGISPLTVIVGILVGAALGGIPGALVAVPLAAALQVILRHTLHSDDSPSAQAAARVVDDLSGEAGREPAPLRETA